MISVLIFTESRYPADRKKIRDFVAGYLQDKVRGDVEVSVSIVGDRKMKRLNESFRKRAETTDVLAFPLHDPSASSQKDIAVGFAPDMSSPDKKLRLGDIVISYPQAVLAAAEANVLVNKKMEELLAHGLDHLLGKYH